MTIPTSIDELVLAMVEAAQAPTLAEAALAYARAGIRIFPTKPRDKSPLFGSHGHLDATCDEDKVREWWTKHPQANIACSPGRSGFLVVDIDGPDRRDDNGEVKIVADGRKTWRRLRAAADDSSSYFRTLSPGKGKGQHAWFRYPAGHRIGCPKLVDAPGLQAYGVLGYVMLPPSVHPDGPSYTFDTTSYAVSDVPGWLLARIPETTTGVAETASDSDTDEFVAAHSGQGLSGFWQLAVDAEADDIRNAELRHPILLSTVARVVGWATAHEEFDLDAGLLILLEAITEAFTGEDRNPRREFRRALNWVVGHELASLAEAKQAEEEARFGDWPPLKPLQPDAIRAPLHHLPRSIREVVDAVAEHTQTPPEHAMLAVLSTVSAATVGNAVIDLDGWLEPSSLWTISVGDSSDRKTAVLQLVTNKPLTAAMLAVKDELTGELRSREAKVKAATARLAAIEKNMQREEPTATAMDWAAAKAELDEIEQIVVPDFLLTDATPESIELTMEAQNGAASATSSEGDLISSLAGRYSDKQPRVGPLNSAWSNEPIHIRRVKGNRSIPDPHLSMTMLVQPAVLHKLGTTQMFIDLGFTARFLYAQPGSNVGYRSNITPRLKDTVLAVWQGRVTDVLRRFWGAQSKVVLPTDRDGQQVIRELRERIELQLRDRSMPSGEHYWLGKAVGQVGRVALVMALAEDPSATTVAGSYVERAAGLFDYFHHEACLAFGMSVETAGADVEHAAQIALWIKRRYAAGKLEETDGLISFSFRDLYTFGPGRYRGADDNDRLAALELLSDHHFLKPLGDPRAERGSKGGRPSAYRWAVSPRVLQQTSGAEDGSRRDRGDQQVDPDDAENASEKGVLQQNPRFCSSFAAELQQRVSAGQDSSAAIAASPIYTGVFKDGGGGGLEGGPPGGFAVSPLGAAAGAAEPLPPAETSCCTSAAKPQKFAAKCCKTSEVVTEAPEVSSVPNPRPAIVEGSQDLSRWCNPNLLRNPINAYVADGYPTLQSDGSCSRCSSAKIQKMAGFVTCLDCGTIYTALVISGE